MKNFKRLLVASAAVATISLVATASAMAADGFTVDYNSDAETVSVNTLLPTSKQMTVLVVSKAAYDTAFGGTGLGELNSADIYYIDQDSQAELAKDAEENEFNVIFQNMGLKTGMTDGEYYVLVGGTDIAAADIYKTTFTKGATAPTYVLGDCDGTEGIDLGDSAVVIDDYLNIQKLTGDNALAADCDGTPGIDLGDSAVIIDDYLNIAKINAAE